MTLRRACTLILAAFLFSGSDTSFGHVNGHPDQHGAIANEQGVRPASSTTSGKNTGKVGGRKVNTKSTKAKATARGASAKFDSSKLKPTKIQKGEWSSPDHTLRGERFDIFWGDKRSSKPWEDFPADSPEYFDPREIMKTADAFWATAVDEMQVYRGDHYVLPNRIRIVIVGTWKTWRGRPGRKGDSWYAIGGGIVEGKDGKKSLPGGHIIVTPKAAMDPYVATHELTHALQTFAAWDRNPPGPPVDAAAWKVFGMTHESHATFIPLLAGIGKGKTKLCVATLSTKHLRPGRKRPYQNWTWMQFLCDKENPRFYSRVIQDHRSLAMHPFESIKRRKKFSAKQFADYWFEHAQRNVTGDYTTPNIRLTIERMRKDKKPLTVKMLPVTGKPDTFEVPTEFVPQRFAYNHILLNPANRKKGKSHKISVTLRGKPNKDKKADWRFGFCVITRDDTPRYVGPASDGKSATVKLAADDKQVYLVVMATPDNLSPFDSDNPKEEDVPRYPYTVKIQGAVPDSGD